VKVLVVEDDVAFRDALVQTLQELGHEVVWATTGRAGVFHAISEKPDVVFLDIGLPDITGYEVARRLPRGLPLIILSGTGADQIRHDAISFENAIEGAILIMGKPVNASELESALTELSRVGVREEPGDDG
jgi:DNA-binding response OmpR family regulator